jgi:polysaccharide deacetylase 2 family uncharacterized protein YibQ
MGAALAIGLGGGVLLAVMNPLIPNEDKTLISPAPIPTRAKPAVEQGQSLPAVPADEEPSALTDMVNKPAVAADDMAPKGNHAPIAPVQTGGASGLAKPATNAQEGPRLQGRIQDGNADLAPQKMAGLSAPQASDQGVRSLPRVSAVQLDGGNIAGLTPPKASGQENSLPPPQESQNPVVLQNPLQKTLGLQGEAAPRVMTTPARPVELAEPKVDVALGDVAPKAPDTAQMSEIEAPQAMENAPATQIARKPLAPQTDAIMPAPAAPPQRRLAHTQGTFKTTKSRLALNGAAGFSPKNGTSGITALKARTEKPVDMQAEAEKIGALDKNAVAFSASGKPLFAIIIMDSGPKGMSREALLKMPFPVSVALPADMENAGKVAQEYRDAGIEVLALSPHEVTMGLSGGLDQGQVDEVLGNIFKQLPQAIGLVDRPEGDLQRDRQLVKAVVNRFKTTGHGLITYERGLNPVPRQAAQAGVYAGQVYKVLDHKTQGAMVIKRFLDRAGQLARRDGRIIVMANNDAQTVAALVSWALGNKARGLALAPVSAVLRASR